jgi:RNA polymerase sigma-70 factor (ECF subfamily)
MGDGDFALHGELLGFPCVPSIGAVVRDDAQLIDEALRGDAESFGELVRKYQDRLFNTVLHVAGRREEAEDVVQEAFVQAFLKLSSFQRNSAFYTWLYRVAFNIAISRKRRRRAETSVEQHRESTGVEPLDDGEAPEERVLREERAELLSGALQRLSDEHRAILVLREMEGCCYDTIAEILDLPVGTVRSRLHRARLQLRDELKSAVLENSGQ